MRASRLAVAAVFALAPLSGPAQGTRDAAAGNPRIDQRAMELARAAAEFLARQPALSFDWFVSHDEVLEGREKITHSRSGSNLLVRDLGFVSQTDRGDAYRDYYYDGETFTIAAPDQNYYASAAFTEGFEALVVEVSEKLETPIPLWTLMTASLPDEILEGVDGAAYLGVTRVGGREAHHLAFSDYDEDWQFWVSTDPERPLPLMIVRTDPYSQGWPQYRAYLMNWDLEPEHEAAAFTYEPPEGSVRVSLPALAPPVRDGQSGDGATPASSGN